MDYWKELIFLNIESLLPWLLEEEDCVDTVLYFTELQLFEAFGWATS
jgi:hypothetical protein